MKKVLFTAVSALAVCAAIAADSTQFGVLKVPSSAKTTIVAVPWLESGTADTNISISNLVLTSGLAVGDQLFYYKGSTSYDSWILAEDSETNVKYWTPGNNVTVEGVTVSASANDQKIAPGGAIMLKRENPGDCFYIMGKPLSSAAEDLSLPSGSAASPVYALIAPPTTTAQNVNALTWTGLSKYKDRMIINRDGVSEILTCTATTGNWGSKSKEAGTEITIPAGQGAWFISYGEGTKSVKWTSAN